jgi:creatinine amidohydrolase
MNRELRLQWLGPDEINSERARCPVVYLPIGPLEWHGPHLPFGTDPLQAEHTALALADKIGGVVHPTLYIGTERERPKTLLRDLGFNGDEWIVGMDFPSNKERSYYYAEDVFAVIVRFTLEQLISHDYRMVVLVNGHGATNQIQQLQRLASECTQRGPAKVLYTFDLDAEQDVDAGHATITETSAILALNNERVDLAKLPPIDQPLQNIEHAIVDAPTFSGHPSPDRTVLAHADPRFATIELGQQHFEKTVDRLAVVISNELEILQNISGGAHELT